MKFVAVTSCPTGIAHSQMAAENLEQIATDLGHEIDVEVQGAMGQENELSSEAIAAADAVIIAADTSVSQDRFEDKPLVKGSVKDAVNDAQGLVEQAIELGGGDGDTDADQSKSADATAAAGNAGTAGSSTSRSRGGDRSKGLFQRLKRLFS